MLLELALKLEQADSDEATDKGTVMYFDSGVVMDSSIDSPLEETLEQ